MSTATTTPIATGTWAVDPVHSTVSFRVRHFGVSWLRGGFEDFQALLRVDEAGQAQLEGAAPVPSIRFRNEDLVGHLQSPDFFDAELHPQLTFRSRDVTLAEDGTATVRGQLTMRGHTSEVMLTGSWAAPVTELYGSERMGLDLAGEIDRDSWGISWNAPLPDGGMVLGPRVRLGAELEFVRQADGVED